MRIIVRAKSNAREERVEKIGDNQFRVLVAEPPVQGRANAAIIRALAAHLKIAPSHMRIISGTRSKYKLIEIKGA